MQPAHEVSLHQPAKSPGPLDMCVCVCVCMRCSGGICQPLPRSPSNNITAFLSTMLVRAYFCELLAMHVAAAGSAAQFASRLVSWVGYVVAKVQRSVQLDAIVAHRLHRSHFVCRHLARCYR